MRVLIGVVILMLAACGADGPPERPTKAETTPGISVSGRVAVGIAGGS